MSSAMLNDVLDELRQIKEILLRMEGHVHRIP